MKEHGYASVAQFGLVEIKGAKLSSFGDNPGQGFNGRRTERIAFEPNVCDGRGCDESFGEKLDAVSVNAIAGKIPCFYLIWMAKEIRSNLSSSRRSNDVIAEKEVVDKGVAFKGSHQLTDVVWTNNSSSESQSSSTNFDNQRHGSTFEASTGEHIHDLDWRQSRPRRASI